MNNNNISVSKRLAFVPPKNSIISSVPICKTCGNNDNVIQNYKRGVWLCKNCGYQVGDRIVSEQEEWRSFQDDDSSDIHKRVGFADPLLGDAGLTTSISTSDRNGGANLLRLHASNSINKLQRYFGAIDSTCARLGIGSTNPIRNDAKELFRKCYEKNKFRGGRKIEVVIVTCIFIACRLNNQAREAREMCTVADVTKKEMNKCYGKIKRLGLIKIKKSNKDHQLGIVRRYCNKLKLPERIIKVAETATKLTYEKELGAGRRPATVAGACIYFAILLFQPNDITINDIAAVVGMGESTIKNHFRKQIFPNRVRLAPDIDKSKVNKLQDDAVNYVKNK